MARVKEELWVLPCCVKCQNSCKIYTGVEHTNKSKNDIISCPFKNKKK